MIYLTVDKQARAKQRQKASKLRRTSWWKEKLAQGQCYYCGDCFNPKDLTMDHKVPVAQGGVSSKNNVVVACKKCNNDKKCQTAFELERQKVFLKD